MSNLEKLYKSKDKNKQIFASAILDLRTSQGFYSRLCRDIEQMDTEDFASLEQLLEKQNFQSTLDVVLWLEC